MPKARFTSLDLRCLVRDIQNKLLGLRVANVYDLNSKTYLLKLYKPDAKIFLLIESGVRIHSTTYTKEHKEVPSVFTMKLRKALTAKRIEKVTQFGFDRVIDLTFGTGEAAHHVICEFYAGGNIVLTDASYKIMALLRTYKATDGSMNIALGEVYPTQAQQNLKLPTIEDLSQVSSVSPNTTIRDFLAKNFVIGIEMIDHCLAECQIDGKAKCANWKPEWAEIILQSFAKAKEFAESSTPTSGYVIYTTPEDKTSKASEKGGKNKAKNESSSSAHTSTFTTTSSSTQPSSANFPPIVKRSDLQQSSTVFFDNFIPFQFLQYRSSRLVECEDFDSAVDEYFSKIESQKVEAQRLEQETSVTKRLDKVREDNEKRVQSLIDAESRSKNLATLIEQNSELIDKVIEIINGYLAKQIDWKELAEIVKQQKKKGDPLASVIHKLKLEKNSVSLLLYPPDNAVAEEEELEIQEDESSTANLDRHDDDDEHIDDATIDKSRNSGKMDTKQVAEAVVVDIALSMSARKNASSYFTQTKKASEKKNKTLEAANIALAQAEKKVKSDLKEVKLKASVQKLRSPYWFEKFNWFISSDGFIVVSGRDMQQNELLYKRYLAKGDAYIHADIHGASTCIIKNPSGTPIPPRTLSEAGTLSVCHSNAWKNKVVTSAWWVEENQVSKTAPSGEYLSTGSFMIRGKKNYLPPSALVMGFGILFRLSDESIAAHMKESTDELKKDEHYAAIHHPSSSRDASTIEDFIELGGNSPGSGSDDEAEQGTTPVEEGDSEIHEPKDTSTTEKPSEDDEEDEEDEEEEKGEDDQQEDTSNTDSTANKFVMDLAPENDDDDDSILDAAASIATAKNEQVQSPSDQPGETPARTGKKYISKHERAKMKKNASGDSSQQSQQQHQQKQKQTNKPAQPDAAVAHAKKKKIPKKYRFQDEEERQAAMELLGSAGHKKDVKATAATTGGKKPGKGLGTLNQPQQATTGDQNARVAARKAAQDAQLAKDKEEEEIRQLMKEEKLDQLTESDMEKVKDTIAKGLGVNLSALTGRPRTDDVLLYAMAVCAPYESLSSFKYKVKVTPGNFKKGKSGQLAIAAFLHQSDSIEKERQLIKAIPDTEIAMTMISNAKLQMAGLQDVIKKK